LTTAFSGIIGAVFALSYSSPEKAGDVTSWILPFTSGGFLYISLASILPEMLSEKDTTLSLKQILSLNLGILTIYWFSLMFH
jgi:zinc transporter 13